MLPSSTNLSPLSTVEIEKKYNHARRSKVAETTLICRVYASLCQLTLSNAPLLCSHYLFQRIAFDSVVWALHLRAPGAKDFFFILKYAQKLRMVVLRTK